MSQNEQYCAYIAKDKILPHLRLTIMSINKAIDNPLTDRAYFEGKRSAYQEVEELIEAGLYDWQRGSE